MESTRLLTYTNMKNKFALQATKFVVPCYNSSGKLTHGVNFHICLVIEKGARDPVIQMTLITV